MDVESGDIVGINTCIRANMEGTSFAIPINKVMGILDDLYEGKHITHGYLGVQMSTMNPTLARYYNKLQERSELKIPEKDGVMIEKVCLSSSNLNVLDIASESNAWLNFIAALSFQLGQGIQKVTRRSGRTEKV